jgi:hypothetical protein
MYESGLANMVWIPAIRVSQTSAKARLWRESLSEFCAAIESITIAPIL